MSPARYALRRLAFGLAQVLVAATAVYALTESLPGDAAVVRAGDQPDAARIAVLRDELGLDVPVIDRYLAWLGNLLHGDLGTSLVSGRPVAEVLADGLAPTALLALGTLALVVPIAMFLGAAAAVRERGLFDRGLTIVGIALYSVPEFALAVVLVAVFALHLGWLPATAVGAGTDLLSEPSVLILPFVVLAIRPVCSLARLVRAGLLDARTSEHVRHARRLGLSPRRVLLRHTLPGALAPAAQHLARTADWLLGGVVVVEAVFVVPGLGTALVDAVAARDVAVVQGLAVFFAATTVVVNLLADLTAFRLAPRAGVAT
ncbi:ABC transporter permease [Yinghuangia sp. YIM S09857]|uniref:ABC transporter permease n=1 Tax=Yinghuangia sp. YIM S09857 TaxID=3436929 RepID=UPI003F5386FB